ncbi:MAG: STAS domain-containing protein [Sneathiella sp.]
MLTETSGAMVPLPHILNLSVAEELREKFLQHLPLGTDLELDASQVETITTPCIQVIVAAGISIEDVGNKLTIHNPSTAFSDAFSDLGLTEYFDNWRSQ